MEYSPLLQTLGLTSNEAQIYEVLLQTGQVQAHVLIAKSGLKRATVYKSLYTLEAKGLVKQTDIAKKLHFAPSSPQTLLELSERQFEKQQRTRDDLRNMLPLLTSNYIMSTEKPIVTVLEGIEGYKQGHLESLIDGETEICSYEYFNVERDSLLHDFWEKYMKKRVKMGIGVRSITSDTSSSRNWTKIDDTYKRTTKYVDVNKLSFLIDKNIIKDKVILFSNSHDKLITTIIQNAEIAKMEKAVFDLCWDLLGS